MIAVCRRGYGATTAYEIAWVTVALRDLRVRDDVWARVDPAHRAAHRRLWTDVVRRAHAGHVAAPASPLALATWQSGHGAMDARPTAMGSDSTISRSGRQGPPSPSTDRAQAAESNIPANLALEINCTDFVEGLVMATGRSCDR